jgi:hypothetical protein
MRPVACASGRQRTNRVPFRSKSLPECIPDSSADPEACGWPRFFIAHQHDLESEYPRFGLHLGRGELATHSHLSFGLSYGARVGRELPVPFSHKHHAGLDQVTRRKEFVVISIEELLLSINFSGRPLVAAIEARVLARRFHSELTVLPLWMLSNTRADVSSQVDRR